MGLEIPPTEEGCQQAILDIVVENEGLNKEKVGLDDSLMKNHGLDSLSVVELMTALSDRYNVEVNEDEAEGKVQDLTVRKVAAVLHKKREYKAQE